MVIRTGREVSSPNDDLCRMNSETNQSTNQPTDRHKELWGWAGRRGRTLTKSLLVFLGLAVIMIKLLPSKRPCSCIQAILEQFPDLITFMTVGYCSSSLGRVLCYRLERFVS